MKAAVQGCLLGAALMAASAAPAADPPDPRLRNVQYDPDAVVLVPVQRGVVTHILLEADEAITDVASGLGADCSRPEAQWCISAQAGGHHVFVKPKSNATAANNLAVITDRRAYSFRLVLPSEGVDTTPLYRLVMHAPPPQKALPTPPIPPAPPVLAAPTVLPLQQVPARDLVAGRLESAPEVLNAAYSIAAGKTAEDIVPTLVFDDGRFTYLRFPGHRRIPAVFDVLGDGSEAVVNTRMEGDLLVVDRVSHRLMLRAGSAAVAVWNDDFDLQGRPPVDGTAVVGVLRRMKTDPGERTPALPSGAAR